MERIFAFIEKLNSLYSKFPVNSVILNIINSSSATNTIHANSLEALWSPYLPFIHY